VSPAAAVCPRPSAGARVFQITLALFIAVAVARIPDVVPALATLRPGKLLALPLLVTAVVALPRWQLLRGLRTTTAKSVAVIAALCVLSVPLSIWPSHSAVFLGEALMPALVLFVMVSAGFSDRRTAGLCILTLVISVGADALYLLLGSAPMREGGRAYIGADLGQDSTLDPNDSAALFVATLPFAMALVSARGWKRWLGLAVAMLLVAGVVKTGSRGGVIGLLAIALILIVRAARRRRWAYVLGVAACTATFVLTADETQWARFRTIFAPESDYNFTEREGRIQVWHRGIRYMLTHPVLGVGVNNFTTAEGVLSGKRNEGFGIHYTAAHNAFVQIGAEVGVIGLVVFVIALWSAGRGCRRIQRLAVRDQSAHPEVAEQEATLAAAAYCSLGGLVTTAFFLSLAYHPITLFVLGACVGVQAGSPYDSRDLRCRTQSGRAKSPVRNHRLTPRATRYIGGVAGGGAPPV
jgi:O-antigen ligase